MIPEGKGIAAFDVLPMTRAFRLNGCVATSDAGADNCICGTPLSTVKVIGALTDPALAWSPEYTAYSEVLPACVQANCTRAAPPLIGKALLLGPTASHKETVPIALAGLTVTRKIPVSPKLIGADCAARVVEVFARILAPMVTVCVNSLLGSPLGTLA